jgi:signal peptidase I
MIATSDVARSGWLFGAVPLLPMVAALVVAGLAIVALGVLTVRRRLVVITVRGASMEPTYRAGDRVLVRRVPLTSVRPGQPVVIEQPEAGAWTDPPHTGPVGRRRWMIKRAVAVPGDPIAREGFPAVAARPETNVPPDRLLVLGDNAELSYDSRHIGYIPADRVLGIVVRSLAHRSESPTAPTARTGWE